MSQFKLVSSTKAYDVMPVNKYVSTKTGLTVIIANVEGPTVNGFFCLATEAHDDDGLPHTLEHLIFLGSERYPYKGILDLLANRCMAHGTNAWTDTDHTCYTIDTAGDEGMLTLLPIYLDHILRPTLTDEGFTTEVHHIDGDGENAGVVYCEMQGRENTADSRCELKLLRAMYPNSGYSSETGGIMKNLRESTTNVKVRDFHKKFYRPENLTIILTGQIEANDVFKTLSIVEDDIIAQREKEAKEEWVKPWQTMPPLPNYGDFTEQWPADTEDCGQVIFGWRGPLLTEKSAIKDLTGCAVLLRYLCDTAAAPLQRCLVEREDALAGDVSYNLTENLASLIKIQLDNVPMEKLKAARAQAQACLKSLRAGEEVIDMDRMKRLLQKQLRESMASLESDPHHAMAFRCIGDALYSQSEEDFRLRMNPQETMHELLEETSEFWLGLLKRFFTDDVITIIGSPSIELQEKMADEEKKRLEEQRAKLGESGLAQKAKALEQAMEFNERPPPPGTLASVPVPSCENLKCHNLSTWATDSGPCPYFDLKDVPLYTRVHSLKTNFVYINLILDTSQIDEVTRKWLPLHLDALAECPVRRGDKLIPHEEVISTTEQLTVSFSNDIGFGKSGNFSVGQYGQFVHIEVRCEPSDYEEVVNHLYEVLYAAELTKERLLVFAQRLINDVSQVRRAGHKMVYDILRDSLYEKNTNAHWATVLRQQQFLKDLVEQLNAGGDSAQNALDEATKTLKNITEKPWLHLASDLERYQLSTKPWKQFAKPNEIVPVAPKLYNEWELMSGWGGGFVVGVGGVESSFLAQLSPGPSGSSLKDAPLSVALNYFTQLEGPMWREVRGGGLSYGYALRPSPHEAALVLSLYRATNAVAAYSKVKAILEDFLAIGKFDAELFASAKSTALFEVVEVEKCPADVVKQSLFNYIKRVGTTHNRELICAIAAVTEDQALKAASRWLPSLFQPEKSKMAIVCHSNKAKELQGSFQKLNIKLEAFESMEASHFNK
ncbi:uncharacterized protein C05D11.1-like [Pieris brassicae]|uniref:uncharacterized protein C05D11.1-like n=1 Tax=Pieris brassicae TaxID=7116 RepID=UPI001E660903|nr:uncharacterized protein C05D11.1-like [Pieris brassicae]